MEERRAAEATAESKLAEVHYVCLRLILILPIDLVLVIDVMYPTSCTGWFVSLLFLWCMAVCCLNLILLMNTNASSFSLYVS